jgi:hypothetical protein
LLTFSSSFLNNNNNTKNVKINQASSSAKINIEEMLTVMASYEVANLQVASNFGQDDMEIQKLRSGKKRLSTFAVALAKPPTTSSIDNDMSYRDVPSSKPKSSSSSNNKNNAGGGGGGGGLARLMGKSSAPPSKDPKQKQWPTDRARDNRNSMLRSKLKAGREQMKAEEEKQRQERMSVEDRTRERILIERQEAQREEAERIVHEREAREHALAAARIAERNIEVAARRQRLMSVEPEESAHRQPESQYNKWSKFYDT